MDFLQVNTAAHSIIYLTLLSFTLYIVGFTKHLSLLQKHIDSGADISVSCLPVDER